MEFISSFIFIFVNVMQISQPQKYNFSFLHFHPRRQRVVQLVAIIIVLETGLCAVIDCIQFL